MKNKVKVIGAGLAGSEAAYYLAERGVEVELYDIKPKSFTPAHSDKNFCELVCSNSLKGKDAYSNACGLLKVERKAFAAFVTKKLTSHENVKVICGEVTEIPQGWCIIATGPLTCGGLSESISGICGGQLHFFDASAPIVSRDSLNFDKCLYGKGGDDYINCPLNKEEYENFVTALLSAERAVLHEFEKREIFEGCMPVEVMAARGFECLRFANLKPVGLRDKNGNKFYAVLQLRKENSDGTAYNLVGCQTNLKWSEQKRVFSLIPALENAEFLRYGVMHRNTFINSPNCLNADFSLKNSSQTFFAGQITGVEGYVESAASGILAAVHIYEKMNGRQPKIPDNTTVMGALSAHISGSTDNFQPMNANFGILKPLEISIKDKKQRYTALAERAIKNIKEYKNNLQ